VSGSAAAGGAADRVEDVRRIAVLRANGLGDLVFSLPALEALRAAYPRAPITLLGAPWHAMLLEGRPAPVDSVLTVPVSTGVHGDERTPDDREGLEAFFARMQGEHIDVAVQLHGGGKYSNPFVRQLGARLTVGMQDRDAVGLDRVLPYAYWQNEVLRYLEVMSLLGAPAVTLEPALDVTEADLRASLAVVPESSRPLVALHPGASDARRRWPPERFAAVADVLARRGAAVVLTGGPEERHLTAAVRAAMRTDALDTGGRLSLPALLGTLRRAHLFVGDDSGPLHLAAAVGTATVGVFWCGNMINGGPLTRLRHRAGVSWRVHCPVCGASMVDRDCGHRPSFVDDVPVEEIAEEALSLWDLAQNVQGASTVRSSTVVGSSRW
jgi:ADP-heptose:LPS heptosyltransferase